MRRVIRLAQATLVLLGTLSGEANSQRAFDPTTLAAWVQYTVAGVEARAVVTTTDCPSIEIDSRAIQMSLRAMATSDHPNLVCATPLPEGARKVVLQGQTLPVPKTKPRRIKTKPRRIVIMGDTGCRLSSDHGLYQDCDNDSIWPFAYVARAVAAYKPDVIIYTGDYIYREADCPDGNNGCDESPPYDNTSDTQAIWQADWFNPARPVQLSAPIVFLRGNHEICTRAGKGWFRYLDAYHYSDSCAHNTPPWSVQLGDISLGLMDTARVDTEDDEELVRLFAAQLLDLKSKLGTNAWIATHRPFWGFGADDDTGKLVTPTGTLQDAVRLVGLPDDTRLIVSAHIHLAELISFEGDRPPQLVVANGGTQLVPRVEPPSEIDGMDIAEHIVLYQYGFVTMEAIGKSKKWRVSFRDIEGRELEHCRIEGRKLDCDTGP